MFLRLFQTLAVERRQTSQAVSLAWPERRRDEMDPLAQMALANAADANLLRLVLCAASATLVLALASSLV